MKYSEGEEVYYKNKKYYILSVMDDPSANWTYSLCSDKIPTTYSDIRTVWRGKEHLLTKHMKGQMRLDI